MKTHRLLLAIFTVILLPTIVDGQGSFQNLGFESADPVSTGSTFYPYQVTFASALPGWSGYLGSSQTAVALYNDYNLGAASIDVFGPGWSDNSPGIIDGSYSIYLQPGSTTQGTGSLTAAIAQTGTIPENAESLLFSAWQLPLATPFSVSFNSTVLSAVVLYTGQSPSGQSYDAYGVDISQFAGQTGQLEFTVYPYIYNSLLLDDISFSPTPVPEPNPLILTGIGAIVFGFYRQFAVKRK